MSEGVKVVVGELELLEGNQLPHPVGSSSGGVGVHVEAAGHGRFCLPGHGPAWDRGAELPPVGSPLLPPAPWCPAVFGEKKKKKRRLRTHTVRGELMEIFGTFPVEMAVSPFNPILPPS